MSVPADHIVDEFRAALDHNAVLTGGDADPFLLDPRNLRTADAAVVVRPADTAGVAATAEWTDNCLLFDSINNNASSSSSSSSSSTSSSSKDLKRKTPPATPDEG